MALFDWFKGKGNEKLVSLLRELAQEDTDERRAAYYSELLSCRLLMATPGLASTGLPMDAAVTAKEETSIRFAASSLPDGRKVMLVFTDEKALLAWREVGCDTIEMDTPHLCALALTSKVDGIAVNIKGPAGGLITRQELESLAKGVPPP